MRHRLLCSMLLGRHKHGTHSAAPGLCRPQVILRAAPATQAIARQIPYWRGFYWASRRRCPCWQHVPYDAAPALPPHATYHELGHVPVGRQQHLAVPARQRTVTGGGRRRAAEAGRCAAAAAAAPPPALAASTTVASTALLLRRRVGEQEWRVLVNLQRVSHAVSLAAAVSVRVRVLYTQMPGSLISMQYRDSAAVSQL